MLELELKENIVAYVNNDIYDNKGKLGESIFTAHLSPDYIIKDLRNINEYREKDIDFEVINKRTKNHTFIEVKTQTHIWPDNKIQIEIIQNWSHLKSWFSICEADYMCFVGPENWKADKSKAKFILIHWGTLKSYIMRNWKKLKLDLQEIDKGKSCILNIPLDNIKDLCSYSYEEITYIKQNNTVCICE